MNLTIKAIELDTTIQCRATIDVAVVNDYAQRMSEGDIFPPIEVFGTKNKCWIGDGWHRVLAAKDRRNESISATLRPGGRAEALKHALSANAAHGHRRTNADKRRCVEIALREFPKMSSRAVAKMCGVSNHMVDDVRPQQVGDSPTSPRTGQDGKQYPSTRRTAPASVAQSKEPERVLGPPSDAMDFARMAVMDLQQIRDDDVQRSEAFNYVQEWIKDNEN